jgi:hypothetical protein
LAYQIFLPTVLLVHNIISTSNDLANTFPETPEFKISTCVLFIFYIPSILLLFGILLQSDAIIKSMLDISSSYNYLLVGVLICYLGFITFPLIIKGKNGYILKYICQIPFIVLMYFMLDNYNMYTIYTLISSFIESIYLTIFISDTLIMTITNFSKNDMLKSPHNLYCGDNIDFINNSTEMANNTNNFVLISSEANW